MKRDIKKTEKGWSKKNLIVVIGLLLTFYSYSQENEEPKNIRNIRGGVTLTNNGISLIPSFSLGKPAAIFDLSIGGEKLSFDPQFRFDIENARPWAFILWWRYKLANNEKFKIHVGAHPAWMFHEVTFDNKEEGWEARRFLAAEISPTIPLTKHISLKPYYLGGHGFDRGLKNTHYLTMRAAISNMVISEQVYFSFRPELYYLKMDENDGFYFASVFSLNHRALPFSLGAMINKKIESDIDSKDFIWNVSLSYTFGSQFIKEVK